MMIVVGCYKFRNKKGKGCDNLLLKIEVKKADILTCTVRSRGELNRRLN